MLFLRLVPVALALVVLGAHFLRAGDWLPLAVVAALLVLLFVPRRWSARALQAGLVLGALEWIRTLADLVAVRQALHQPFLRMAAILGGVALLTAASALVFRARGVRTHFGFGPSSDGDRLGMPASSPPAR